MDESVIDYCERQSGAFWAEPVNALTNIAFLFAASAAVLRWRRRGSDDYPALALILVAACVGIGSFLFHTFATRGAMLLDVVPIAVFIHAYFFLALSRFFAFSAPAATLATIAFAAFSYLFQSSVRGLNGSVGYLPALGVLIVFAALVWRTGVMEDARRNITARTLGAAAAVFLVSLFFRTIDRAICANFPLGSHFLWHMLNACVLWLLLRAAMLARPTRSQRIM